LQAALFALEQLASAEYSDRLDSALAQHLPCVSLPQAPFDRALELWFYSPEVLIALAGNSDTGTGVPPDSSGFPAAPPPFDPAGVFSLVCAGSSAGKGSEEDAVLSTPKDKFMGSLNANPGAHGHHEPVALCNGSREDLPLPKEEGRGEGEQGVRITD